jgi:hypothetical protein
LHDPALFDAKHMQVAMKSLEIVTRQESVVQGIYEVDRMTIKVTAVDCPNLSWA